MTLDGPPDSVFPNLQHADQAAESSASGVESAFGHLAKLADRGQHGAFDDESHRSEAGAWVQPRRPMMRTRALDSMHGGLPRNGFKRLLAGYLACLPCRGDGCDTKCIQMPRLLLVRRSCRRRGRRWMYNSYTQVFYELPKCWQLPLHLQPSTCAVRGENYGDNFNAFKKTHETAYNDTEFDVSLDNMSFRFGSFWASRLGFAAVVERSRFLRDLGAEIPIL
eukprot:s1183_g1.t1